MRSTEQEKTRLEQLKKILGLLSKYETIGELAKVTGIPKSTIQRRLNDKEFITKLVEENNIGIPAETICNNISAWLNRAQIKGRTNGGTKSQQMHGFTKDDTGQFNGPGRKPR